MVDARRAFLEAGHYDPLIRAIAARLDALGADQRVFDAGCGEGAYLRRLAALGAPLGRRMGLDISKVAVRLAAKADREGQYLVGSSFDLPLLDDSVDAVLRVFAPGDPAEARRVLRPGGLYLVAAPGPRHLIELKQRIYDRPREHAPPRIEADGFELLPVVNVDYRLRLDGPGEVANLLAMTPYYWSARPEVQESVRTVQSLDLTVSFQLHLLRRL
ncbi:MAG: methyltransferase domain-containing protein [Gammaproteobacteria bacterium]